MTTTSITILGLGPGSFNDLTLQARALLAQAAQDKQTVYFRTIIHPTVEVLRSELPTLHIESFDQLYDTSADWTTLYSQIAEEVCTLAAQQPIIYAVPGHPLMGESSVQLVLKLARSRQLSTRIVAGLSFLEPVCTALELDPFDAGTQIIDATSLATLDTSEVAGKIIPTTPLLVTQVYNRRLASAVKLSLGELYPDEWPVKLVRAAGVGSDEMIIESQLYELDRQNYANHLSTLYVPPLDELAALRLPETLRYITMRLRRDPDGCPWDRQQTHQSLMRYVLEETYEVVEALEENDMEKLAEELGDLLLQVYLHAEVARQEGDFTLGDVLEHINAKLIRRHPHVFGDVEVSNADQVNQNWEAIKRQERAKAGKDVKNESILDGVPPASPALMVSQEYQKRVVRQGFAFATIDGIYAKLAEELEEIRQASTQAELQEEIGDLFFVISELARWHKVDAEAALRQANHKFRLRFKSMEKVAREEGRQLTSYSREEWIALWQQAKH
ncbi:nucleoside triphosphate pyrophosphohydrolase [Ktedonosporobacter rubrisoli]|uniref:Nucleoside triphosphate pyrophosphohydrolase n=1 Tax=Ktedonosporobacter rubrisoli TaxID=2509675 RepID=A0A4V0YZV7_KTERU|nr:nucleoside triphosphate pyrophosphohydrolase [Ktedonosporobacter rubrisoli]QBD81061.1 nucleoside triphosphate pyrophosphohydrolase [Ktedonosporobacter rubrisoli]